MYRDLEHGERKRLAEWCLRFSINASIIRAHGITARGASKADLSACRELFDPYNPRLAA